MRVRNFARLTCRSVQPLYFYGNPQWRVFLPKHKITLLNPARLDLPKLPHNYVLFEVEMSMTEHELMDYLKNLYEVPVANIWMTVSPPIMGQDHRGKVYVSKPECRIARVLLQQGYFFDFPKLFEKVEVDSDLKAPTEVKSKQAKYRDEVSEKLMGTVKEYSGLTEAEKRKKMKEEKKFWQRLPGKTVPKWF
ncbi:large ribosomal subunit protein uL23m-like isoform X1 [Symsagittifera roscoffensis]|uniref:large ribosomal subunit protein uL23m-like isoform X1 n=1 Tax=Symsagittifera roscoffensis TaxID=84072 RepID=UPI00307BA765